MFGFFEAPVVAPVVIPPVVWYATETAKVAGAVAIGTTAFLTGVVVSRHMSHRQILLGCDEVVKEAEKLLDELQVIEARRDSAKAEYQRAEKLIREKKRVGNLRLKTMIAEKKKSGVSI